MGLPSIKEDGLGFWSFSEGLASRELKPTMANTKIMSQNYDIFVSDVTRCNC